MYCPKCGTENDDNAWKCVKCGNDLHPDVSQKATAPQQPPRPLEEIPNYLVHSILVTLFCCLPLGIPAIVFAAQVNGKMAAGDIEGAKAASKNARTFCWISLGLGLAWMIIYGLAIALPIIFGGLNSY